MSWRKLFGFQDKETAAVPNFDRQLVRNLRRKLFPSRAQIMYLGHFLSRPEKIIIKSALALAGIAALSWLGWFTYVHHQLLPKSGGEYSEAMVGQPKLVNPIFASANDIDADLAPLLYSGLFQRGKNQKLIPDLAAGYTVGDDQRTYDIKLREDAVWTDGEKIDADDVVFTFRTIQNPEVNSPLFPAFQGVTVEKIGDLSVRFSLKEPFVSFLNSLTTGIIPEHVFGEIQSTNLRLAKENIQPKVTSGPWLFVKLIKENTDVAAYVLERNEKYHGNEPWIKTLSFHFYRDQNEAAEAVRAKETTAASFLPDSLVKKIAGRNLDVYRMRLPQYTALFFNQTQQPFLKEIDLRKALALAIEKKSLLDESARNSAETIDSPILPGTLGFYPDIKKIVFNPDEANKLLDAKWPRVTPEEYFKTRQDTTYKIRAEELKNAPEYETNSSTLLEDLKKQIAEEVRGEMSEGQTFYRQDKNKNPLFLIIATADTAEYRRAAEILARLWRTIGIPTAVQTYSSRQINNDVLRERNYEILLYGEILGDDPDPYPFWHSSQIAYPGLNLAMFADRNVDKMLEEARTISNETRREKLYRDFQDVLVKEMPAIFLYAPTYLFVADKQLKGVELDRIFSPSERYNNLSDWYLKTKWAWK